MGTVSQHQLASFSSPVNGTSPIDANTVRGNDNSIRSSYNAHDADTTIHLQNGAVASRPAASTAGQMWLANDSAAVYLTLDTGSAWVDMSYLKLSGGTLTGGLTVSGASTFTVTAATPIALNRGDAAQLQGYLTISRVGTVKGYLGLDASDNVAFLKSDASVANLTITDAGAGTFRAGVTATTGTFSSTLAVSGLLTASLGVTIGAGTDVNLAGAGFGITNGTTRVFSTASGLNPLVTMASTGGLAITGDVAVNTNKFTVTASSGNTVVAGTLGVTSDLAVNTNKFTVAASSGNTVVAGTLAVTGTLSAGSVSTGGSIISSAANAQIATSVAFGGLGASYGWLNCQTTASVSTVATAISPNTSFAKGGMAMVYGSDGTNKFADLVFYGTTGTPSTVAAQTLAASPTARTYSMASNTLKLAMASGTYTIETTEMYKGT